ncbi:MAG: AAA family ATPase [Candidatus Nezhaarchaeota archaeon]|nr:AAA family ATPase [Candidatus Nezhaarchaeota archaeon]
MRVVRAPRRDDYVDLVFKDLRIDEHNAPCFILEGEEVSIWDEPYVYYHSRSPIDYVREQLLLCEEKGVDPFPSVVGKAREKELVKTALMSGSSILFKGSKGYGKTTFSKAIAQLLPSKLLAVKGCKVNDDPTRPICFSCKRKLTEEERVELAWVPRIWVRVPGDPMMTTRQLIGGVSIQKIREGYDLDHPEVFVPGRVLKANRGVSYFDELGAIPSQLQTLLHELIEEGQVTTTEGEIVPMKVNSVVIAATNPANYRGTNPIKEPLLDRVEVIEVGPPDTLEDEVEIGLRNMYLSKEKGEKPSLPPWHAKVLARIVRIARDRERYEVARRIVSEPSCRATIKLFDHVTSAAIRRGGRVPLLKDYGPRYDYVKLSLAGRMEVSYEMKDRKDELVERLVEEALNLSLRELYSAIPQEDFDSLIKELKASAINNYRIPVSLDYVDRLKPQPTLNKVLSAVMPEAAIDEEYFLSALEMLLEAISRCTNLIRREGESYLFKDVGAGLEARVPSMRGPP